MVRSDVLFRSPCYLDALQSHISPYPNAWCRCICSIDPDSLANSSVQYVLYRRPYIMDTLRWPFRPPHSNRCNMVSCFAGHLSRASLFSPSLRFGPFLCRLVANFVHCLWAGAPYVETGCLQNRVNIYPGPGYFLVSWRKDTASLFAHE